MLPSIKTLKGKQMNKITKILALILACMAIVSAKIVNQPHGTDRSGLYGLSTDKFHAIIDRTKPVGVAKPLEEFVDKAEWMEGIKLSSDGKYILSSGSQKDKILKLIDAKNGKVLKVFRGHKDYITAFALSYNSQYAISGTQSGEVIVWDIKNKKQFTTIQISSPIRSIALTPKAEYAIVAIKGGVIKIFDIKQVKLIVEFQAHTKDILSIFVSRGGKYILTSSKDASAILWSIKNINQPKKVRVFNGHDGWVYDAIISNNQKYIITASADKTAKLWSVKTAKAIRTFKGHKGYVFAVAISKDGAYLLTASADKTLRLWDVNKGRSIREFLGHKQYVKSVAVSLDGVYAYSSSTDGIIYKWVVLPNLKNTVAMCMTMIKDRGGLLVSTKEGTKPKLIKGDGRKGGMIMSLESFWGEAVIDEMTYDANTNTFNAHISFANRKTAQVNVEITIPIKQASYFQANVHKMRTIPIFKYDDKRVSLESIVIVDNNKKEYKTKILSTKGVDEIY